MVRVPATSGTRSSGVAVIAAAGAAALTWFALVVADEVTGTRVAAVLVGMIFGAYAGFAIAHGNPLRTAVEVIVIGIGVACAALGLSRGRSWIAAALVVHALWDIAHHPRRQIVGTRGAPRWYVAFCATYDLAAAGLVLAVR